MRPRAVLQLILGTLICYWGERGQLDERPVAKMISSGSEYAKKSTFELLVFIIFIF